MSCVSCGTKEDVEYECSECGGDICTDSKCSHFCPNGCSFVCSDCALEDECCPDCGEILE